MRSQQLYMSFKAVGDLPLGQDGTEGNFLVSSCFFLENYLWAVRDLEGSRILSRNLRAIWCSGQQRAVGRCERLLRYQSQWDLESLWDIQVKTPKGR